MSPLNSSVVLEETTKEGRLIHSGIVLGKKEFLHTAIQSHSLLDIMVEPSKFGAILNSGYFRFLSISDCGEEFELLFSSELMTNCFSLNMVYKMYLSYNFE